MSFNFSDLPDIPWSERSQFARTVIEQTNRVLRCSEDRYHHYGLFFHRLDMGDRPEELREDFSPRYEDHRLGYRTFIYHVQQTRNFIGMRDLEPLDVEGPAGRDFWSALQPLFRILRARILLLNERVQAWNQMGRFRQDSPLVDRDSLLADDHFLRWVLDMEHTEHNLQRGMRLEQIVDQLFQQEHNADDDELTGVSFFNPEATSSTADEANSGEGIPPGNLHPHLGFINIAAREAAAIPSDLSTDGESDGSDDIAAIPPSFRPTFTARFPISRARERETMDQRTHDYHMARVHRGRLEVLRRELRLDDEAETRMQLPRRQHLELEIRSRQEALDQLEAEAARQPRPNATVPTENSQASEIVNVNDLIAELKARYFQILNHLLITIHPGSSGARRSIEAELDQLQDQLRTAENIAEEARRREIAEQGLAAEARQGQVTHSLLYTLRGAAEPSMVPFRWTSLAVQQQNSETPRLDRPIVQQRQEALPAFDTLFSEPHERWMAPVVPQRPTAPIVSPFASPPAPRPARHETLADAYYRGRERAYREEAIRGEGSGIERDRARRRGFIIRTLERIHHFETMLDNNPSPDIRRFTEDDLNYHRDVAHQLRFAEALDNSNMALQAPGEASSSRSARRPRTPSPPARERRSNSGYVPMFGEPQTRSSTRHIETAQPQYGSGIPESRRTSNRPSTTRAPADSSPLIANGSFPTQPRDSPPVIFSGGSSPPRRGTLNEHRSIRLGTMPTDSSTSDSHAFRNADAEEPGVDAEETNDS